jgi:carbamoyltransferase
MYILGLNAYHGDSSAAIYKDGTLIAATEEERIRRLKHWAGLPTEAIKFCLNEAGITLKDVDYITVSRNPMAKIDEKIFHTLKKLVSISAIKDRAGNSLKINGIKKEIAEALGFTEGDIKAKVKFVEHHRSHIASSFFVSPFEESAILSIDGFGDFTSTMRGIGKGNKFEIIDSVSYPHSLGAFYTTLTQFLGFPHYGDEYKVMGLAPYGKPTEIEKLKDVIIFKKNGLFELNGKYFKHFKEGVSMSWEDGDPHIEPMFSDYLVQKFGTPRAKDEPLSTHHWNLATSVQRVCEELIFHIANDLYKKTGLKNLCITGGVAQNSVANGKIIANTPFTNLFVPPAGHDAGTSVGSALFLYHQELGNPRSSFKHEAYTGAKFSNEEIETLLKSENISYTKHNDDEIFDLVTDCLINAGVVGWFQGRAEFGPRALGNRSIITDPRRVDAKEILNAKIKRRESFRPFAPSILREYTDEYFENADSVPFMEKVFPIRAEKQALIPAVTHVDGTGRLQTVTHEDNPRYYSLIKKFYDKTGVPILLNTSFNENEPIVNTPKHALDCYLRTKMDMLVLENCVVRRDK